MFGVLVQCHVVYLVVFEVKSLQEMAIELYNVSSCRLGTMMAYLLSKAAALQNWISLG